MLKELRVIRALRNGLAMLFVLVTASSCSESAKEGNDDMTIITERSFEYSPEAVYSAWVSEETVVPPVTRIEKEVRVGGFYRLFVEMPEFTGVMEAEYKEVVPNEKLVYTWEWNDDGEETIVDVTFKSDGEGCLVQLTHGEFQKQESFDQHSFGWQNYFDGLEKKLTGE